MSVIISRNFSLGGAGVVDESDNPRILVENVFTMGTVTASEEVGANNGWLENAVDGLTFDYWEFTTLPAWLEVELTEARPVDMCAIGLHSGLDYVFQYYDGSDWVNLHDAVTATTTAVEAVIADEASSTKFRIYITGAVDDKILGIVMLGKALTLPKRFYGGHAPITLNRTSQVIRNTTEGGYDAGVYHMRTGAATSVEVTNMEPSWIRLNIETLNRQLERQPFVFAWRPSTFPDDVAYCWLDAPIRATNSGPRDLMSLQFDFHAFVGGDALVINPELWFTLQSESPYLQAFLDVGDALLEQGEKDDSDLGSTFDAHPTGLVAVSATGGLKLYQYEDEGFTLLQDTFDNISSATPYVSLHPDDANYMLVAVPGTTERLRLFQRVTIGGTEQYIYVDEIISSTTFSYGAWSPDGTMIAGAYNSSIIFYTLDYDDFTLTSTDTVSTGQFTRSMRWSPNSEFVAVSFETDSPRFKIFQRDFDDDTFTDLTIDTYFSKSMSNGRNNLAWHPDGEIVVIGSSDSESSIYIYQNDGDDTFTDVTSTVVDEQPGEGGRIYAMDWNPEGTKLLIGIGDNEQGTYVMYYYSGGVLTREYEYLSSDDAQCIKQITVSGTRAANASQSIGSGEVYSDWVPDSNDAYCWFDTDDDDYAIAVDDKYYKLIDKSDNGDDVYQDVFGKRPAVTTIGERSAMLFDSSTSQRMYGDLTGVDLTADFTIAVVVDADSVSAASDYLGLFTAKSSDNSDFGAIECSRYIKSDRQKLNTTVNDNGTNFNPGNFSSYSNSDHSAEIITIYKDDGRGGLRINGAEISDVAFSADLDAIGFLEIGRKTWSNGSTWEGAIGEFYFGAQDTERLEGYFAWKWDLVSVLPGGHPYKSAPPEAA
jgi:hypothetical protein